MKNSELRELDEDISILRTPHLLNNTYLFNDKLKKIVVRFTFQNAEMSWEIEPYLYFEKKQEVVLVSNCQRFVIDEWVWADGRKYACVFEINFNTEKKTVTIRMCKKPEIPSVVDFYRKQLVGETKYYSTKC